MGGRVTTDKTNDIAPIRETSSTDGVFFDGKNVNTKFSLSDGTRIHNYLTGEEISKQSYEVLDKLEHEGMVSLEESN